MLFNAFPIRPVCSFLYSSIHQRAMQTLDIVSDQHTNTHKLRFAELKELGWGIWEGTPIGQKEIKRVIQSWDEGYLDEKATSGESPLECEDRAVNKIYELILNSEAHSILLVCKY